MSMISDVINPYLVWIRIGLVAGVLLAVVTGVWYIKDKLRERDALIAQLAAKSYELTTVNQKMSVMIEELQLWQKTVKQMSEAVKNIKVQSDVYIQGVEDNEKPVIPNGGSIPFIVPGMSRVPTSGGYANLSTSRVSPAVAKGGAL